jgi:7,8-dihydropterin-6-yl-methyl-4-(beta-D-ribofuranosyl)aminobenzene 5'-phosphate synthase
LVAHPDVFIPKYINGGGSIGISVSEEVVRASFAVQTSTEPVWLDERLVFLGQIARENSFETAEPMGYRRRGDAVKDVADYLTDDSALAYVGEEGLHVITGCSHAGICNIIAQSRRVTGVERVVDVIGGLHLLDPPKERLAQTVGWLEKLALQRLHACHCTDLYSRMALARCAPLAEVGSGLVLECE